MNDSIVVRIGTACNVAVAVLLGTLGTIEMFDPAGALLNSFFYLPLIIFTSDAFCVMKNVLTASGISRAPENGAYMQFMHV